MTIPNFLIVGAPKCGTTSLYNYLNQHPDIFLPAIKEPHFFGSDLSSVGFTGNKKKYLNLFEAVNAAYVGEASTWYLYSYSAAKEIYKFNKDMKIIIMLRNPVFAAQSLHSQTLFDRNENVDNFEKAVKLQERRKRGKDVPPNNKRVEALFYVDAFKYGSQIKRYFDLFGEEQIKIILFDDFIKNTSKQVNKIIRFLGIAEPFQPKIKVKNKRKKPRLKFIQQLIEKKNKKVTKFIPIQFRRKMHHLLKRINAKNKEKEKMSFSLKQYLYNKLKDEISLTEEILGKNLDGWRFE